MASVVFLKGVNVGGHKTFRPSVLASKMAKLGVKHVGAAGTFIVSKPIRRSPLGAEFRRRLPFATEAMICSGNEILQLASTKFFDGEPCSPNIVRFVSILAKRPRTLPALPLSLPAGEDWLVKVVGVQGRFVFGLYRRTLRTIGVLAKLEKHLGGSITTRNWNTFSNLFEMLAARIPQAKKAKLLKAKRHWKGTSISRPVAACLAIAVAGGLGLFSVGAPAQGLSAGVAPNPTYSNLVSEAVLNRAQEVSRALTDGGFIPTEQFNHAEVILEGQSTRPSARVRASVCEYWFQAGALHGIRRRDLFEDKGRASRILLHLTNEVLTLTLETATNRGLQLLERLSYPGTRIQELYGISAEADKMTSYPIRNGGPGFPKDLHFYGELISREKIKITVRMTPANLSSLNERDRFGACFGIDLLATTGELLEVHFLPEPETLARLGIHGPEPIMIEQTRDFSPPRFVSITRKVAAAEASSPKVDAAALVRNAWSQLQEQLGTNRPKCILICENLNDPGVVVRQMNALARGVPWAGVSHFFKVDLPFEQDRIDRLARDKRGICLLAVCGGVETRLEVLADLSPIEPPSVEELAVPGGQEKWKQIYDEEHRQWGPRIDDLIQRLCIPENLPDHAMFLVSATIPFPSGSILENELPSRLGGKAQVFPVMGESEHWSVGDGVTYGNRKLLTNAIVVFCVSGFLPLQQDVHRLLVLHAASLSNSPSFDPEKLRTLQARPPARILSGEVINPVRQVAYAFGPHPLEEVVEFFGSDQIKMLRAAERLEVFEINPGRVVSSGATGTQTIEGYEQVAKGKTLDRQAAQEFAAALLTENNGIRARSNCEWQPVVVFRARHGDESASLIACFECNESVFRFYDATGKLVRYTHPFFFSGREVLLRFAREALPGSSKLRSIEAK